VRPVPRYPDVVVVGAGPGGCAAAVQCRRLGLDTLLVDRAGRPGGLIANAWRVENYPGVPPVDGPGFVALLAAHLERFGIQVVEEEVLAVRPGLVVEGTRTSWRPRAVVLAVGTAALELDLPGAAGSRHVFTEVRALLERSPDRAVVVGGGEAALDQALSLSASGTRVTVMVRAERLASTGRLPEAVRADRRIEVRLGCALRGLHATGNAVEVEVEDGGATEWIVADGVLAAIGRRPLTSELIGDLDLEPLDGVHTAVPGLFVVGDARLGGLGQAGVAVGDGLNAALAAAAEVRG